MARIGRLEVEIERELDGILGNAEEGLATLRQYLLKAEREGRFAARREALRLELDLKRITDIAKRARRRWEEPARS